jgi:hypothetical protein
MPYYTFFHKETGEEKEMFLTIGERDTFLKENPDYDQAVTSPIIGDPILQGRVKPDKKFTDLLKTIKKSHKGSTIDV